MHVRSQGEGSRAEQKRLMEVAKHWMEEACHQIQTGERLPPNLLTLYRYYCMATLMVTHGKAEKTVTDFKVSVRLFQCSLQTVSVSLRL